MFRSVKYENFARDGLRSNEVRILGHVARSVHFAGMVDLLNDLNPGLWWEGVATELAPFVVIVRTVKPVSRPTVITLREMYGGDLEIVLCLAGRMCAEKQAVDSVWLICWSSVLA